MPKKIVVQNAVAALLKKTEKNVCKYLPSKAEGISRIKDTVAIDAGMFGITISAI
ncbi:MAG TPA: hypothetical protein VMD74_00075 [Candidatus Methylomirabilis sp.]|nr:hypothetical protein [Candidatus Methylomirabilis sp.]